MAKILGIDLGTTYSAVAYIEGGEPKIIENSEGVRTTPSVVAMAKNGERLVGLLAKRQAITNSKNTVHGVKRLMGHKFDDPAVQQDKGVVDYEMAAAEDGGVKVKMGDKFYRPEEVSAMVLQKLKKDAEARLGEKVEEAVITVPAYFDDSQRQATKNAGEIAGLKVRRIINEPTAAALAYGFNKKKNEKIAVYDFGGGTFDISILDIVGGGDSSGAAVDEQSIQVKSTDGDHHLGGEDIDQEIVKWLANEFKKEQGIDLAKDELSRQRLKEAAEKAKHELSNLLETEINLPFITSGADGPKHLLVKMSRAQLESLARPFVERALEITKRAVAASGYELKEIDEVIMVGGQTRMPAIIESVKNYFGREPNRSINPDEVVAIGAAIQAGIFQGDVKDVLLLDVIPLAFGIETMGGISTKLIEKNTTIPASKTQVFSTAADNQTSVEIHILQGERPLASDNKSLGRFMLDGIPPAGRGLPQIEVTFDVDANGILSVKAKDKTTGREQSVRIEARSSLSKEEIEKMKREAEVHASEDAAVRETVEARNIADQMIYTAEKAIRDAGDKLAADVKKEVEEKIAELKKVKDGQDQNAIKQATVNLSQVMQKMGPAMGGQAGNENKPPEPPPSDEGPEGQVRDAETK